jgi:hypothetical protein
MAAAQDSAMESLGGGRGHDLPAQEKGPKTSRIHARLNSSKKNSVSDRPVGREQLDLAVIGQERHESLYPHRTLRTKTTSA